LTRLGNIVQYNAETKTSSNDISDDSWVFDLEDIEKDTSRILQKVHFKNRRSLSTKSRFRKGDILYGKLRPYLNKVVVADEDGYCTTEIVPIRPYGKIFPTFLMYALKTPDFLSYVNSKTYGIKMPRLGTADALNTIIPLPPLAEQHRIVAKVDRLMALCDELEARQQQERAGCLKLGTASLAGLQNADSPEEFGRQWGQVCDAFDLILDCPENVAVLRQTILQLAVQGRLVRQDPEEIIIKFPLKEKTDKKLAKELKLHFSKPQKNLEDLFSFPKEWIFTSFINVTNIVDTQPNHRTPVAVENGIPYVGMKDIQSDGKINFQNTRKISFDVYQEHKNRYTLTEGDFIIGKIGTIGNPIKLRPPFSYTLSANILLIQPDSKFVCPDFIFYLFKSPMIETKLHNESFSTSQPLFGIKKLRALRIPIPPLAEQLRIVAKVDALMALCNTLETRLKERAGIQTKFTDAVVKNVGTG
jgi:type I restriction enzyme S subunit